ncbi:MAG: DUF1223 domain-containing protein [Actinomycetota bacterium]
MKYFKSLLIILVLIGANIFHAAGQNTKRMPVIVELFTSEGCSTCPPADKFLQKLVEEQPISGVEIIGLSEHVDYWNRLGWTDRFSSAQFSNRQGYYLTFFKNSQIYTPQMVVDGTRELSGKAAEKTLADAAKNPKGNLDLKIEKQAGNILSFKIKIADLPKISDNDKAVVLLAITENDLTSNVSAGENSGRMLKHTAVTRYLKNIGGITGEKTELSIDVELVKDWKRENLSAIAFVQEANSRRILGAAKISLKNP